MFFSGFMKKWKDLSLEFKDADYSLHMSAF